VSANLSSSPVTGQVEQKWYRVHLRYPKQQRLLAMKKAAVEEYGYTPMFHPLSQISTIFPSKFDAILIDPPFSDTFTWDTLLSFPISSLGADPSFIWLWIGSGAGGGLERGREVLAKWGYRRCEDIVWVKTNQSTVRGPGCDPPTTSLLTRTKEHCLMGIRGTVRRSTDSWFVHCNIDTDVIVWEGDPNDPSRKPPEMYTLIENFCLGTRRLELFGRPHSLRRGWVTVGDFDPSEDFLREKGAALWDRDQWQNACKTHETGKALVPNTPDIEMLRPKSPVRGNHPNLPPAPSVPMHHGGHHNTNHGHGHGMMQGNMVANTPNPMMGGFAPHPHPQGVMPGMMPMGVPPMGMPMGMPMMNMNMNPGMQMVPMGMGMGMNPMGMQQYGAPGMGMPMWMGMPENSMMGNQMWMGDGSMNNMGGWGANDPNWHGGQ